MTARPFIKWVGGKTQLLPDLRKRVPESFGRYFEPFIGGAALLFDLAPTAATIGDVSPALVNLYRCVRDHHVLLGSHLTALAEGYVGADFDRQNFYYSQRDLFHAGHAIDVAQAARFIFLNKTGFNGLFRVNRAGKFNVPWGKRDSFTPDVNNIAACACALALVDSIQCGDFADTVDEARTGDFVYFDPPYIPATASANFTSYAKEPFGPGEQRRLRDVALALKARGVRVLLSNNDVPAVRDLYASGFIVERVEARRNINRDGSKRGAVGEVLIS